MFDKIKKAKTVRHYAAIWRHLSTQGKGGHWHLTGLNRRKLFIRPCCHKESHYPLEKLGTEVNMSRCGSPAKIVLRALRQLSHDGENQFPLSVCSPYCSASSRQQKKVLTGCKLAPGRNALLAHWGCRKCFRGIALTHMWWDLRSSVHMTWTLAWVSPVRALPVLRPHGGMCGSVIVLEMNQRVL